MTWSTAPPKKEYLYLQCPYSRKWHPDQRAATEGGDVQKVRSRFTKRRKNVNVPQERQELPLREVEVPDAEDNKDKKKDTQKIKTKCSCGCICSRLDEDSPWKVTKANLEHTGHTVTSKEAQARETRVLKKEWVAMIKDHGHLGLPPSTSYELLEKHFGKEFSNAQIEPCDISNVYYKSGNNCNQFFHLGCFTTLNGHGKSLLTAKALVLRDRDCDYDWQLRQWLNNVPAAPKVLMAGTDVACANAVRTQLTKTPHLWCIWHIIENTCKNLLRKMGKHRYQAMMALFHDVREECNEKIFHRQWNALLDAYPGARDYLKSTWGNKNLNTGQPLGVLHRVNSEF